MISSACLTLAAIHFLVWWRRRAAWAHLLFSLSALGISAFAVCELLMMRADAPAEYALALRWGHVPTWVIVVSLVAFARVYLRAGRLWIAWAACAARTLALLLNFGPAANLNFREVTSLGHVTLLGETVSFGVGPRNPLMLFGSLSLVLLVLFVTDASLAAARRGDRRQAAIVGGSLVFFTFTAMLQAVLVLGGVIAVPLTASPFFLSMLAVMGFQLSEDVIDAARLTDELREGQRQRALAEERLRLVVESSPNGMVLADHDGRMVLVNRGTERLFGYSREELVGQRVEMLVPEGFRGGHPGHRAGYQAAPRARAMGHGSDLFARRRDGSEFPVEIGLSPIESTEGVLVLAAIVDITARKAAEAEAVRQRAELAHFGRVSTMGQLASALAHELNQPLGAILRNAEAAELFLGQSPPDLEEVGAILGDIRKDDRRAGDVIDRMRALLKRREPERASLSIDGLVDDVMVLVQPDALSRKVTLRIEVPKGLPLVRGDRVQLQQVLLNLILNGMDAMGEIPAEERRLVVRARQSGERAIEVAVEDAGRGVPEAKLARLFEPFFTTKPEGMGLGLPISFSIIEAHGGRIWAESRSTGATFFFTLPVGERG
jgi:two-component system sensor kinase FixL